VGQNDFLGEIHIPLANCTLDETEEFQLLAKKTKKDVSFSIIFNSKKKFCVVVFFLNIVITAYTTNNGSRSNTI